MRQFYIIDNYIVENYNLEDQIEESLNSRIKRQGYKTKREKRYGQDIYYSLNGSFKSREHRIKGI